MAQVPNWFDTEFEGPMEKVSAQEALEEIAKCPRIISAVADALATRDANGKKPGWVGPTRTQTVRKAIVEVLEAAK